MEQDTSPEPAPIAKEAHRLVTEMFGMLGQAHHYCDTDYHPRLKRKEIVRIFAEMEVILRDLNEPLCQLSFKEIESNCWKPKPV